MINKQNKHIFSFSINVHLSWFYHQKLDEQQLIKTCICSHICSLWTHDLWTQSFPCISVLQIQSLQRQVLLTLHIYISFMIDRNGEIKMEKLEYISDQM